MLCAPGLILPTQTVELKTQKVFFILAIPQPWYAFTYCREMPLTFINRWTLLLIFSNGKVCKHFVVHCAFDAVFSNASENAEQYCPGFVVEYFVLVWFFEHQPWDWV